MGTKFIDWIMESMPTLLKEFNNVHLKQIWYQAGHELWQADKVIFVGYSFPIADFEIRYLLSKFVKPKCRIDVVLHNNDNPKLYGKKTKSSLPEWRYKHFFGGERCKFYYNGFLDYLDSVKN